MLEEFTEIDFKMKPLIAAGHIKGISEELFNWADPEVADYILHLDKPQQIMVYRALPRPRAANIFAFFEPDDQDTFLEALTDLDTRELLANLNPDDRTALLEELPATVTRQLMQLLSPEDLGSRVSC